MKLEKNWFPDNIKIKLCPDDMQRELYQFDMQRKWRTWRTNPWIYESHEVPQSLDSQESPEWEVFEWVQILAKKLSQIIEVK